MSSVVAPFTFLIGPASASQSGVVTTGTQEFSGQKNFLGPVGVGFTGTPGSKFEVQDSTGASQIRFGAGPNEGVLSASPGSTDLVWGAHYNGASWIADQSTAALYEMGSNGSHIWYRAFGLTPGNPVSFSQCAALDASGNLRTVGYLFSTGGSSPTSGAGATLFYDGAAGRLQAANFGVGWIEQIYDAQSHVFNSSGSQIFAIGSTGVKVGASGNAISQIATYRVSLSPTAVAANSTSGQNYTVSGIATNDIIGQLQILAGVQNGCFPVMTLATAANQITVYWQNVTAASVTPYSGTYVFTALRS